MGVKRASATAAVVLAGRAIAGVRARLVLLAACAVVFSAIWSASASALVHQGPRVRLDVRRQRGRAFTKAGGIAVNESTGEVYVVDLGSETIKRFKPNGTGGFEFVAAFSVRRTRN